MPSFAVDRILLTKCWSSEKLFERLNETVLLKILALIVKYSECGEAVKSLNTNCKIERRVE